MSNPPFIIKSIPGDQVGSEHRLQGTAEAAALNLSKGDTNHVFKVYWCGRVIATFKNGQRNYEPEPLQCDIK